MINMDNNRDFIKNIVHTQTSNPTIYVDQSHLPKTNLDKAKDAIATAYVLVSSPTGTLSLITVTLALALIPVWRKSRQNE